MGDNRDTANFLMHLKKTKARYIRDQLGIVMKSSKEYGPEISRRAVRACLECKDFTAIDFRDFADFQFRQVTMDQILEQEIIRTAPEVPKAEIPNLKLVRKDPTYYSGVIAKGGK